MSTNKIIYLRPAGSPTADLRKRRARLDTLLDVRWRLARLATERRSHNLDDAADTFQEQLLVEAAIGHEFPEVVDEKFPSWIESDAALEHDASVLHPECGICEAIARRAGINIVPLDAA